MKIIVIAWIAFDGRSEALGRALGADIHFIAAGERGDLRNAVLRYVRQTVRTARLVARLRAETVVVQNPPILASLVVWLTQRFVGGELVIDSHSGAFIDRRWKRLLWLHRWLSRRARLTIVHNGEQAELVEQWDIPWLELGHVPIDLPMLEAPTATTDRRPTAVVVCSGASDEPIDAIVDAARALPEVDFRITGNRDRIHAHLTVEPPPNVDIPGFVPFTEYYGRLRSADLVLSLTTRPGTLVNGGFEAIAAQRPFVTSDTDVLRSYFHRGTIFTGNRADEIAAAITEALSRGNELAQDMAVLAGETNAVWEQARDAIVGES